MRAINLRFCKDSLIILKNWLMVDIGDTGAREAIKNWGCIHSVSTKKNERMQLQNAKK